ncbi:hypothetical protein A3I99_03700 [Candidatus Kaiserbacteria bacterium RIFCSPLOWO2_02_FULL_45_11b]|uniref:Uncharacterized protein n=1 Tax=Candidatus Kaiserbacteria bacterium RIFCSPLOWO2_12_FULL_45_26 TaxID=1798525 RepID=A0A1F6FH49_9BACT|nr:MAG: hypothetical protein A2Z56_02020 [Candidatus Kaiserbacteria bacterium RIFCSPHIGHO2_12_45_16]OGG69770.1 MAG: hypothetical protein A2929_02420 [Candidatus Kaiserbacteria bacterium RIFCSPLOWO2_01_FULL_45_25]OGG83695.1 MAG: hypothetical protein A3I99_03700 [Candidatus Kaiserbacteria bacterium RIFCSPLOWO2_02_FULL_45_11b]OGG85188.1 MAG: hypothetical protein A3G90_03985 [Candidatus Kaiserbacteria bacterium RIFCSPLOWO2_12_FULL_45_26]
MFFSSIQQEFSINNTVLSDEEKSQLIQAIGGVSAARSIIYGTMRVIDCYPVFTSVVVGGVAYRSNPVMLLQLKNKGCLNDSITTEILSSKAYTSSLRRLDLKLIRVTPRELNLPDGGFYSDIIAVAKSHGLTLCPQDTAAAIMTQLHSEWTTKSRLIVVSKPIVFDKQPWFMSVSPKRIKAEPGDNGHHVGPDEHLLFRRL